MENSTHSIPVSKHIELNQNHHHHHQQAQQNDAASSQPAPSRSLPSPTSSEIQAEFRRQFHQQLRDRRQSASSAENNSASSLESATASPPTSASTPHSKPSTPPMVPETVKLALQEPRRKPAAPSTPLPFRYENAMPAPPATSPMTMSPFSSTPPCPLECAFTGLITWVARLAPDVGMQVSCFDAQFLADLDDGWLFYAGDRVYAVYEEGKEGFYSEESMDEMALPFNEWSRPVPFPTRRVDSYVEFGAEEEGAYLEMGFETVTALGL